MLGTLSHDKDQDRFPRQAKSNELTSPKRNLENMVRVFLKEKFPNLSDDTRVQYLSDTFYKIHQKSDPEFLYYDSKELRFYLDRDKKNEAFVFEDKGFFSARLNVEPIQQIAKELFKEKYNRCISKFYEVKANNLRYLQDPSGNGQIDITIKAMSEGEIYICHLMVNYENRTPLINFYAKAQKEVDGENRIRLLLKHRFSQLSEKTRILYLSDGFYKIHQRSEPEFLYFDAKQLRFYLDRNKENEAFVDVENGKLSVLTTWFNLKNFLEDHFKKQHNITVSNLTITKTSNFRLISNFNNSNKTKISIRGLSNNQKFSCYLLINRSTSEITIKFRSGSERGIDSFNGTSFLSSSIKPYSTSTAKTRTQAKHGGKRTKVKNKAGSYAQISHKLPSKSGGITKLSQLESHRGKSKRKNHRKKRQQLTPYKTPQTSASINTSYVSKDFQKMIAKFIAQLKDYKEKEFKYKNAHGPFFDSDLSSKKKAYASLMVQKLESVANSDSTEDQIIEIFQAGKEANAEYVSSSSLLFQPIRRGEFGKICDSALSSLTKLKL